MNLVRSILIVGSGCFVGGAMRYLVSRLVSSSGYAHDFPLATFIANIAGCLLMGLFSGFMAMRITDEGWKLFLTVGICGGFTSFSTFSNEIGKLLTGGQPLLALGYVLGSLVAGVVAVFCGYAIGQSL